MCAKATPCKPGTVLARLADWQYRDELAAAQAKYETAVSQMNRALAANDGTEAGIERVQADYWASEVARAPERLEKTLLRSPIAGLVATPHIEDSVGQDLKPGDTFAEVVDTSRASVDVAIDEHDVPSLAARRGGFGQAGGLPTRTFRGEVDGRQSQGPVAGRRETSSYARVSVPNDRWPDPLGDAGPQQDFRRVGVPPEQVILPAAGYVAVVEDLVVAWLVKRR